LDPVLRFVHDMKIQTAGWVKVSNLKKNNISQTHYDVKTTCENIEFVDRSDIARVVQASYDIETYSSDGSFPNGNRPDNVIYQIATTFKKYGDLDCFYKNILTLKTCDKIEDPDNIPLDTECFETEEELLMRWKNLIVEMDPDILYQYNGDRFDGKYIADRLKLLGIEEEFYNGLGKFKEVEDTEHYQSKKRMGSIKKSQFSSGAYGTTDYDRLIFPGRINFDVLIYIQREFKLDSYKLDDVAEKYLKQRKHDITPQQIFSYYADGCPKKIKDIAMYCIQDTILPQRLVDKLDILPNNLEMAKATYVPFKYLIERGQQIKVFSQIARVTSEKGYLIPVLKEKVCSKKGCTDRARFGYEKNDTVHEETCEEHAEEGMICIPKFQGATVLEPIKGSYLNEPITTLDFASLYPSIMRAHNMCYSTFVIDPEYLNLPDTEYEKIDWVDDNGHEFSYSFVQDPEVSVLPGILEKLYKDRKMAKKQMNESEDPFVKSVFNGKQLALKVSMNSMYGFLAANMLKCKPIAASVTARGRQMIESTKNYVEENYPGSVCVYGDSVSASTPLVLKKPDGEVVVKSISSLSNEWSAFKDTKEQSEPDNLQIWSDIGWVNVRRVIRHRVKKKMYRVVTRKGIIEVTEDHSLYDNEKKLIKIKDIIIGKTRLLQSRVK
jgi:DNA polymerase delta subunit 1